MKASGENIDLMLFDYLEGNYSKEKASQIKKQINADPLLREELDLWEAAHIRPVHYDTSAIESSLIQQAIPGFNFTFFLNSVLVLCITFFSSTNILPDHIARPHFTQLDASEIRAKKPAFLIASDIDLPSIKDFADPFDHTANTDSPLFAPSERLVHDVNLPALIAISPDYTDLAITTPQIITKNTALESKRVTTKTARKKSRAYRKMMNRARKESMAREFMKGDIPYVVPIDIKNF